MTLEDLGYNEYIEQQRQEQQLTDFDIGRVIAEHKERYMVTSEQGLLEAEITGNLRFSAGGREDFPAVGDWVALVSCDSGFALIHKILPRFSLLKRQAVGQAGNIQLIAANIDVAFLVQALDRDFNINRLERYLTICHSAGVKALIVLTKTDLITTQKLESILESLSKRHSDIDVLALSNETLEGYDELLKHIEKGKTYCMLGSSGVGKSTMMNRLSGHELMQTGKISSSTSKGRHVTSHRELTLIKNGGILIDNPGMREVGIADTSKGLENTFGKITELAQHCRFKDCTHTSEDSCAVIQALENDEIDQLSYENYLKMEKEKSRFELSHAQRRKKDKDFGKMVKNFKKDMKKRKKF